MLGADALPKDSNYDDTMRQIVRLMFSHGYRPTPRDIFAILNTTYNGSASPGFPQGYGVVRFFVDEFNVNLGLADPRTGDTWLMENVPTDPNEIAYLKAHGMDLDHQIVQATRPS